MTPISRRTLFALGASVVVGACSRGDTDGPGAADETAPPSSTSPSTATEPATAAPSTAALGADPFGLGVAAGDPDATSVVLWTRLVGADLPDAVEVDYELAADERFDDLVAGGRVAAVAADGHAVHVTVPLAGAAWYRFRAGGFTSASGRVALTPGPGDASELRIASASCQHFETGFYAAHRDLAEWTPDLVVFLGDFVYEGAGRPVGPGRVRTHDGAEPLDLAGYRARYARYLGDPDLRAARAACGWVVIWDDHEVDNDYADLSPQDPAETAAFADRRAAAYRAWWEHMPVRLPPPVDGAPYPIHRTLTWGSLVDLVVLDGRQFRDDQACGAPVLSLDPPCDEAADPSRTMLGTDQEAWLGETLGAAGATWTVLGQQTVLSDLRFDGAILNYDQWDGYAPARDRLLAQATATDRLIVLSGDIHLAGVGVLPGVGVEFVTTSISSAASIDESLQPILATFDSVVDAELAHRGYTRHTVTPDAWTAEYRIVDEVADRDSPVSTWRTFRVDAATRDVVVTV